MQSFIDFALLLSQTMAGTVTPGVNSNILSKASGCDSIIGPRILLYQLKDTEDISRVADGSQIVKRVQFAHIV